VPEGPGRYRWAKGFEFNGEWKAGCMHGKGTYVWPSGEKFEGEWKVQELLDTHYYMS
jgi:1-phosphatidylinositol-4-phosphate 5-kinase